MRPPVLRLGRPLAWLAIAALSTAAATVVGSNGAGLLFLIGMLILVGRDLRRAGDSGAVQTVLWLWFVCPELRRIFDWLGGRAEQSLVLLTPFLLGLLLLVSAMAKRGTATTSSRLAFGLAVGTIAYGTSIALITSDVRGSAIGMLNWAAPLGCGYLLLKSAEAQERVLEMVSSFVRWVLPLQAVYGLIQWVIIPAWDEAWLDGIGTAGSSFGQPEPFELRVWGTVDSPGTFAGTLVWLTALRLASPLGMRGFVSTALGLVAIGVSGVRAAYLALALVLIIGLVHRAFPPRRVGTLIGVVVLGLVILGGPASAVVAKRAASVLAGDRDTSAAARSSFQAEQFPLVLSNVPGSGIASTGAAARYSASTSEFANPDSGYLEVIKVFGPIVGIIVLVVVLLAWMCTASVSGRGQPLTAAMSSVLLTLPVSLLLGNVFTGAGAVSGWLFLAIIGRRTPLPGIAAKVVVREFQGSRADG